MKRAWSPRKLPFQAKKSLWKVSKILMFQHWQSPTTIFMLWLWNYLWFQVECDIECLSGADSILVLAGQTGIYEVSVTPLRRGTYNGVLAFVTRKNPKRWVSRPTHVMRKYISVMYSWLIKCHIRPCGKTVVFFWCYFVFVVMNSFLFGCDYFSLWMNTCFLTVFFLLEGGNLVFNSYKFSL